MNYCSPTSLLHVSLMLQYLSCFFVSVGFFFSVWVQVIVRWFCRSYRQFDPGVSPLLIVIHIHENEEGEREREGEFQERLVVYSSVY